MPCRLEDEVILNRLSQLESEHFIDPLSRIWAISQLGSSSTIVAYMARRAIVADIFNGISPLDTSIVLGGEHGGGPWKKARVANPGTSWFDLGWEWARDKATCSGCAEWVELCNVILKQGRTASHPERNSGSTAHPFDAKKTLSSEIVEDTIDNLQWLWHRCATFLEEEGGFNAERFMVALFSLTGGTVKCLTTTDDLIELHSSAGGHYSSDSDESDSESNRTVFLHLPPLAMLLNPPIGWRVSDLEVRVKAIDTLRTVTRLPKLLARSDHCFSDILQALDTFTADALSIVDGENTGNPLDCSFVESSSLPRQVSQRSILLWITSFRAEMVHLVDKGTDSDTNSNDDDDDDNYEDEDKDEDDDDDEGEDEDDDDDEKDDHLIDGDSSLAPAKNAWKALSILGLGRKGSAFALVELLADNDEWLVQAVLDLAHTHEALIKIDASPLTFEDDASSAFLSNSRILLENEGEMRPQLLFSAFSAALRHDERVFLDLLVSSETRALEYILRVLRLSRDSLRSVVRESDDGFEYPGILADEMLGRLQSAVHRAHRHNLMPYNPRALLARFSAYFD